MRLERSLPLITTLFAANLIAPFPINALQDSQLPLNKVEFNQPFDDPQNPKQTQLNPATNRIIVASPEQAQQLIKERGSLPPLDAPPNSDLDRMLSSKSDFVDSPRAHSSL